jgi:spermidine synthase
VGGIIGVSFFLIPKLGTHASLQILAGATIGLGVVGLLHGSRSSMVGFLLLGLLPFASESAPADGIIFRGESPYNQVLVREEGGKRFLALNLPASTHSVREGDSPWTGMYYDDLAVASLLAPGSRGLVLGMGAGSSIRATHALIPDAQIDAVEIDPLVVQVADRFFDLGSDSGLHIAVADARPWLRRGVRSGEEPYDFVQIDLYHGGPFVPFYLATAEFYGEVRARMSEGGVMAMNVFDASRDGAFLQATVATLHSVFPTVLVARGEYTHLVLGILDGRSPSEILRLLSRRDRRPGSKGLASRLRPVQSAGATPVWTDDRAPVEEMTFSMLIECAETHGAACR